MTDTKKQKIAQLELPPGMSPDTAVKMLKHRLERYARDMRKFGCANAVITTKDPSYDFGTSTIHPGDVIFSEDHCKNPRGEHSRFCESCAKKNAEERANEVVVKTPPPKKVHFSRKKRKQLKAKQHGLTQGRHN
jgi:hypothetical protein